MNICDCVTTCPHFGCRGLCEPHFPEDWKRCDHDVLAQAIPLPWAGSAALLSLWPGSAATVAVSEICQEMGIRDSVCLR